MYSHVVRGNYFRNSSFASCSLASLPGPKGRLLPTSRRVSSLTEQSQDGNLCYEHRLELEIFLVKVYMLFLSV